MRSGAAEARQLRQHVLAANHSRLRLPSEEAVRRLVPGPIGTSDLDPAQVADDVSEGWVSRERAEAVYGVVVNETPTEVTIDLEATEALRRSRKEGRS